MSPEPVICFGQQPCGFFPKRFLVSKIETARRLQREMGGAIVFFCHDSDHDPRETRTLLRHRKTGEPIDLNFTFANKIQRKYSPVYLKRVLPEWQEKMAVQLPAWIGSEGVDAFKSVAAENQADFCLEMYRRMGLLEGIRVLRSSDPEFRSRACGVTDFYVDVPYEGEVVRSRYTEEGFQLHAGGEQYITFPLIPFTKEQMSPARDPRLKWMQSVVRCTHYVAGASEQDYMCKADAPEITYVPRDFIEHAHDAYTTFRA